MFVPIYMTTIHELDILWKREVYTIEGDPEELMSLRGYPGGLG